MEHSKECYMELCRSIGVKMRKKSAFLISIIWPPLLGILFIASLDDALNRLLFCPFWQTISLSDSLALSITVLTLCVAETYLGWNRFKVKYGISHIRWYAFAWFAYGYFNIFGSWVFLNCFGIISCWFAILVAYPLGVVTHWSVIGCCTLLKKPGIDTKTDETAPLIIVDDYPITELNDDLLGYNGYAEKIAKTITKSKSMESFSIGIEAPWGSGKTSMLNLIRQHLNKDKSCIVVLFNPRQSASVDFIQEDFLSTICNALKPYHSGASSAMHDYMQELKVLSEDTIWEKAIGLVHIKDTSQSREDIEQIIKSVGKKLVVIIDDLDRLTGEEIMEVLKLIDKNASFKHTFFISAYDKKYVNDVLKHYLGESIKTDFTDKYFTLEIPLPEKKPYRKINFLWTQLCKVHDEGKIKVNKNEITETINKIWNQLDATLVTVRDIKRFLGQFFAVYSIVEDNVILKDYMLLQLLRIKEQEIYMRLRKGTYFKYELFGNNYATNYTLKEEKDLQIDDSTTLQILRLLFPHNSSYDAGDKEFGNRHLSWKRSFDYYFYGMESGHIDRRKLISISDPNISLDAFKQKVSGWISDNEKMEVADFVIEKSELVKEARELEQYVRLMVMTRYYCPTHMIYLACVRHMVKSNLEDYLKQYEEKEDLYVKTFRNLLESTEWILSAILLQDTIRMALSPGQEIEMIFDIKDLQSIANTQLDKVLKAFHANSASSEDVYEVLKANISDVDPGGITISANAIEKVKTAIISRPALYLNDMIGHRIKGKNGIVFVINEHLPYRELFKDDSGFYKVMNEIESHDEKMESIVNRISDVLGYIAANKYQPTYHATKGRNDNIKQGDYETYSLILEGER